jgi:hypothetical protein
MACPSDNNDCSKNCTHPVIKDPALSGPCVKSAGVPVLEKIHRTLPARPLPAGDPDVLQDEFGAAILDEVTGNQIYDDLKA